MCVCTCVCMHVGMYAKQEQCLNMHTHLSIYLSVYLSIRLTVCLSVRRSCLNDRHGWVPRYACHMMRSGMARWATGASSALLGTLLLALLQTKKNPEGHKNIMTFLLSCLLCCYKKKHWNALGNIDSLDKICGSTVVETRCILEQHQQPATCDLTRQPFQPMPGMLHSFGITGGLRNHSRKGSATGTPWTFLKNFTATIRFNKDQLQQRSIMYVRMHACMYSWKTTFHAKTNLW